MTRVRSVDALRGGVVALMIFVNAIGGMPGVPAWTQHLPSETDGYSLTDLVFPWFLFLVGVSLPLSLGRFTRAAGFAWGALGRIIPRALGLIVLGLVYINEGRLDAAGTGMTGDHWKLEALVAALVLWGRAPGDRGPWRRRIETSLRLAAAAALAWLLVIFRGKLEDGSTGLVASWWGILGMIGWAYLVGSVAFLIVRGDRAALVGLTAISMLVYIASRHDRLGVLTGLDRIWSVGGFLGSTTGLVLAGAAAGTWLTDPPRGGTGAARPLLWWGLGLWAAGWLLRPLHGYHKNAGTESWALVAAGQASLLLAALHLRLDRNGKTLAPGLLEWCGRNALLAYVLPELMGALAGFVGLNLFPFWGRGGIAGIANDVLLTWLMVGLAALAARRGVLLRL